MKTTDKYAKAIVGAVITGLAAYQTGVLDGVMTQAEWTAVAVAFITGLAVIWGVPNSTPNPTE